MLLYEGTFKTWLTVWWRTAIQSRLWPLRVDHARKHIVLWFNKLTQLQRCVFFLWQSKIIFMIVDLTEFYISLLLLLQSPLFESHTVNFKQIQFFLPFLVKVNYVFYVSSVCHRRSEGKPGPMPCCSRATPPL